MSCSFSIQNNQTWDNNMDKSVIILEKCLQFWEDRNLLFYLGAKVQPESGKRLPTSPYHDQFRKYLNSEVMLDNELSDGRFGFDKAFENSQFSEAESTLQVFPYCLASWVKSSRRVFKVESDLQMLLDATSLEGVTYGDIRFPFQSFMVELERPLVDDQLQRYSSILVTSDQGDDGEIKCLWFYIISDDTMHQKTLMAEDRQKLRNALQKNNDGRIKKIAMKLDGFQKKTPWLMFQSRSLLSDELIEGSLVIDTVQQNIFMVAIRVTLGLCLYLKSLPVGSDRVSDWRLIERVQSLKGRAVSNNSQACSVASTFKLSAEERFAFSDRDEEPTRSFGEKCCHFRRGTWCKPPNSGPEARRTKWRRPTIVRLDKLEPGQLPKGSEAILGLSNKES
jgi:hypothetical protein